MKTYQVCFTRTITVQGSFTLEATSEDDAFKQARALHKDGRLGEARGIVLTARAIPAMQQAYIEAQEETLAIEEANLEDDEDDS